MNNCCFNATITNHVLEEICCQQYANAAFSAGLVRDHPVEDCYIKLERQGEDDLIILLRKDELAAICWVGTGTLWSILQQGSDDD